MTTDRWSKKDACFKKCSNCGFEWDSRDSFLSDKNVEAIGYQANFEELLLGLIYFNHSCGGTITIPAYYFVDLYNGPIFEDRVTGKNCCPEYCLRKGEVSPCPEECECAYIREVLQIIKNWPKCNQATSSKDLTDNHVD